jgi:hypothetical protein
MTCKLCLMCSNCGEWTLRIHDGTQHTFKNWVWCCLVLLHVWLCSQGSKFLTVSLYPKVFCFTRTVSYKELSEAFLLCVRTSKHTAGISPFLICCFSAVFPHRCIDCTLKYAANTSLHNLSYSRFIDYSLFDDVSSEILTASLNE